MCCDRVREGKSWNFLMDLPWVREWKGQCSSPSPHTNEGTSLEADQDRLPGFVGRGVVCVGSSQVSDLSCPSVMYTPNPVFVC